MYFYYFNTVLVCTEPQLFLIIFFIYLFYLECLEGLFKDQTTVFTSIKENVKLNLVTDTRRTQLNNQQCHNQRIHLCTKHLHMYFYQVSCSIPFSMYTHAVTFVKLKALWKGYVVYCTRVPIHLFSLPPNITFTTRRSDDWTINPALDHCQT